jgi:hippurate hydrolase
MITAGALDGVAAIFGAHVDLRFEVGTVVAQSGNVAASADEFFVELKGRGSHAARPHEGSDPIVGAAALVTSLQTIVSRRIPPGVPAVVTVSTIAAGTATNVVPHNARISGTLRAADRETRALLHAQLQEMTAAVARAHGLTAECQIRQGTPPLANPPDAVQWAQAAVRRTLGDAACVPLPVPNLGGEDFAFYLERIPGCFLRIGGRRPDQDPAPAHSSRFLPDDGAVLVGAAVLAELARTASRELNASG